MGIEEANHTNDCISFHKKSAVVAEQHENHGLLLQDSLRHPNFDSSLSSGRGRCCESVVGQEIPSLGCPGSCFLQADDV